VTSFSCRTSDSRLAIGPAATGRFRDLVRGVGVPLSVAPDQINRSRGKDLYPFVLPAPVLGTLDVVASAATGHDDGVQ
jgi:hypothetical protein